MRFIGCGKLFLGLLAVGLPLAAGNTYGKLPISFEPNRGQTDARVRFLARASGYTLFVTADEAVFAGRDGSVERMRLMGVKRNVRMEPLDKQPGISNYFIGNDPSKWRTNIPNYGRVALRGVYPGIDLIFYGNERQLEYDWVVAPGANPKQIRVKWEGLRQVTKNASGDLVLSTALIQRKPVILQEGKRIEGGYAVHRREVAFELVKYDAAKPLVIDPVLLYSTYLGGSGEDIGYGIALDGTGGAYVTGQTRSTNFPIANPLQASNASNSGFADAFVTKLNADGSARVYSTYLGGNAEDQGRGIAVDGSGNAYVTGSTKSTNFPIANPLQASFGGSGVLFGGDAFLTKINASGSALMYSTYLGGSGDDSGYGIAVDGTGNAYVTGYTNSTNFPTANSLQASFGGGFVGSTNAFVTKINAAGSAYVYSTYLGGSGKDQGNGIAADGAGNAYIAGDTRSSNFPTANPMQRGYGGFQDVFVTKINATGSALVYSTYLGGSDLDFGQGIAVDGSGSAYVTGYTASTNFPTTNPLQANNGGGFDAFMAKVNATGSALVYSTYLGGSADENGFGVAVDGSGNAYVTGQTRSTNFPTNNPLQASLSSFADVFVTKINAAGSALEYSTYLGGGADIGNGIAVDGSGKAYVTGSTSSTNFPTINPLQANLSGTEDAFVLSISESPIACTYSLSLGGIAFAAQGGSGTITITTAAGCPWTVSGLPAWVTLTSASSGTGSGTVTFQVLPTVGGDLSGSFTVAGQTFTVEQVGSVPGLAPAGSLAQVNSEGGWSFELDAVNLGTRAAATRVSFTDPNGNPLLMPLTFPQLPAAAGPELAATLDRTINAHARLVIESSGPANAPALLGSGQLFAHGPVSGFGIFSYPAFQWNAVVPLETRNATTYYLPFDNTGVLATGVALTNISNIAGAATSVQVTILNDTGIQIGTDTITLTPQQYEQFLLNKRYPQTANMRGTIQFQTSASGQISALGVRANGSALTTLPLLSDVDSPGGSISDVTYNGGFTSTFYLVNTGSSPSSFTLSFFDQNGNPLTVPLSFPQNTTTVSTAALTRTLAAGQMLELTTQAQDNAANISGSAQLTTTGSVSGFEIFRWNTYGQEASVPLETRTAQGFALVFDNTGGLNTGVALANAGAAAASITALIYDDQGNLLERPTINLPARAQEVFMLPTNYPITAGRRGMVEFVVPLTGPISMIGIRTSGTTLTTVPILAN